MGRQITIEKYLNMLAEKSVDNTRQLRKSINQRRNGMEDLYGVCFSANGDASTPASFYISLSPDYVYLQRFAFKFVVKPFVSSVKGGTESATVVVNNRDLQISGTSITPNPHNHGTQPHAHNVIDGVGLVPTTSRDWQVLIAGVDITPYLLEQQDIEDGVLFDMSDGQTEKVFPNRRLSEDVENFYDILDVASVMNAEGLTDERDQLLKPEFKKVEIRSNAPFGIDAYLYMKYSNLNR